MDAVGEGLYLLCWLALRILFGNSGSVVRSVPSPGIASKSAAAMAGYQWETEGKCTG